jgi:hypothetical protein
VDDGQYHLIIEKHFFRLTHQFKFSFFFLWQKKTEKVWLFLCVKRTISLIMYISNHSFAIHSAM